MDTYRYKNKAYGFMLLFPQWWKDHCFITYDHIMKDAESSIHFNLRYSRKYKGQDSTNIFSLIVFKTSKEKWEKEYEGSSFQFLGAFNGRLYAAIAPEEPPEEFLKKDKSDYMRSIKEFQMLMKMENVELPRILKSFRITRKTETVN